MWALNAARRIQHNTAQLIMGACISFTLWCHVFAIFNLTIYDSQRRSHRTQTHLSVNYLMEQTVDWCDLFDSIPCNLRSHTTIKLPFATLSLSPSICHLSHVLILISFCSLNKLQWFDFRCWKNSECVNFHSPSKWEKWIASSVYTVQRSVVQCFLLC